MPPLSPHPAPALIKVAATTAGAAAFALGAAAPAPAPADAHTPPNIVWIFSDDHGPELGCYGYDMIHTPNLDRLAAEGAMFTRAYTTAPVCSASRSAIFTGMYQTTIGAHNHRSKRDVPLADNIPTLVDELRKLGYFTVINSGVAGDGAMAKKDFNWEHDHMNYTASPYDAYDWGERAEGQPFFAQVNIFEPHRVFARDEERPVDPASVEIPPYYPDTQVSREDFAAYYEAIQMLDKKVGIVLQRIEDEGLADNTIVVFMGDNGRPMPRSKQFLYEGGIHVPLIVRWPGVVEPGTVTDRLVSAIDLTATSIKAAGGDVPHAMQGLVFLGPDQDPPRQYVFAARDRCDETVDRIRSVRGERFKYIRNYYPDRPYTQYNEYKWYNYPILPLMTEMHEAGELTPEQALFMAPTRPAEELYDLVADPHELNNLHESPDHQEILASYRRMMDVWVQETGDRGGEFDADAPAAE